MKSPSLWKSFGYAFSGARHVLRTQRNARLQLISLGMAVSLGLYLQITPTQWALIVLTSGSVLAAEFANTVIETLVDLVSPERHELARIAKDVAAGAVLVLSLTSVVVGLLILGPPLWERLAG